MSANTNAEKPAAPLASLTSLQKRLRYDEVMNCMRCGFCLPACPTYAVTGNDFDSPRGRISLVRAVAEGALLPQDPGFRSALDQCIGCLACQEVCPSGVQYGEIFEGARAVIETSRPSAPARRFVFGMLFERRWTLRAGASALWLYQRSGLGWLARRLGVLRAMGRLGQFEAVAPRVAAPGTRRLRLGARLQPADTANAHQARVAVSGGTVYNARAVQHSAREDATHVDLAADAVTPVRVGLFTGCIMDALFGPVNEKTAELLRKSGCEVVAPVGQACCGALHAHNGALDGARALAKRNIVAFERSGAEYIVSNAGGCGAQFFEYPSLLEAEPEWQARAQTFLARVVDISELLVKLGVVERFGPVHARVTFQDSCHLRNVMGVWREPRKLLQSIPGVEYVEMPGASACCGSGGVYNLTQYDSAMRVLDKKMVSACEMSADIICTANPGCQLQMALGIERAGQHGMRSMHIVELLTEALDAGERERAMR